ncbi:MAG: hypothetical protein GAK45_00206 [Pseudomonas citronellolis]|nr:MAG: hypothetical protein GAK45_00206 [Pseudomonas citronellolis]
MKLKLLLCAACLGLASRAFALTLAEGIAVEPPAGQQVTYQVLPFYDTSKKVLARWSGDQLSYYVSLQALPAGSTDPDAYIQSLVNELKAAGGSVAVGRRSTYQAAQGFRGIAQVLGRPEANPATPAMVVHVITDGQHAYLAIATGVETTAISPDELLRASTELLRSVHASGVEAPIP